MLSDSGIREAVLENAYDIIVTSELNGSDYCAVKLDSDEVMTIGYLARKGTTISKLGQKYLEEIAKYKDKALR